MVFLFLSNYLAYFQEWLYGLGEGFRIWLLDVARLNYAVITLIPKEANAIEMRKFRLISLGNYILKIRLSLISHRIISNNQIAFIEGRFILESSVASHEVIHDIHSK